MSHWLQAPLSAIHAKFKQLEDFRQTILIVAFALFVTSIITCLIGLGLRQVFTSRLTLRQEHENIEYVMLPNVDNHDEEETKDISTNGYTKQRLLNERTIPTDDVEDA